jgi:hypothetical protein
VQPSGGAARPNAWAMINLECPVRTLAVEYALAIAPAEAQLAGATPTMITDELDDQAVQALADAPAVAAGAVWVTGPLYVEYRTVRGDGATVLDSQAYFWPYHVQPLVKVNGQLAVMDLSIGDAPVPLDDWLDGLYPDDVVCRQVDPGTFYGAHSYWIGAMQALPVTDDMRPDPPCMVTFAPLFRTFRPDLPLDPQLVRDVPQTMTTQLDGFLGTVRVDVPGFPEAEAPLVRGTYLPRSEAQLCADVQLPYCEQ